MPDGPRVAITMGDPAGIGPEIVVKALCDPDSRRLGLRPVVVGDLRLLRTTASACALDIDLRRVDPGEWSDDGVGVIDLVNVAQDMAPGHASAEGGEAAWAYIDTATRLCTDGHADALVTAPINKYSLELAGRGHEGHTEMLMDLTGSPWSMTVFLLDSMRVAFYSRHLSLAQAVAAINAEEICEQLTRLASSAPKLGLTDPLIGVAALNPHAGENGLFGREEIDEIEPGIAAARKRGVRVEGPVPADAIFHQAREGRYDAVLGLYHDQVSAVLKAIDFHRVVSVTLGLPFLRLSVDHGTAFDIAGTDRADHRNMTETLVRTREALAVRATAPGAASGPG
jgi:4-phospho-D-threonate 3-dehydrogenase / 4-phospho-D-erythronate 3-dehydrogenase